jgi:hypothetical protein
VPRAPACPVPRARRRTAALLRARGGLKRADEFLYITPSSLSDQTLRRGRRNTGTENGRAARDMDASKRRRRWPHIPPHDHLRDFRRSCAPGFVVGQLGGKRVTEGWR